MQLGMIGLGRMGGNMVRRLMKAGHQVRGLRPQPGHRQEARRRRGDRGDDSLADFAEKLTGPKTAWVMVPAGGPTEATVVELAKVFKSR